MGRKKRTQEAFIKRAVALYGGKYSYEDAHYVDETTPVRIFCTVHKEYFHKTPRQFLFSKSGCPLCSKEISIEKCKNSAKRAHTTESFILASKDIHGDKYDYSLTEYSGKLIKLYMTCKKHSAMFWQRPAAHLLGQEGCAECRKEARRHAARRITTQEFVERSMVIHGDKYDYSLVNYEISSRKVEILCKKHGNFQQTPNNHLSGAGCPLCHEEARSALSSHTTEDFVRDAVAVHGDKYDYSKVAYVHARQPVEIVCKVHNTSFMQTPNNHKAGCGCPLCAETGFKKDRHAYLYVLKVHGSELFVGFGITNNKDARLGFHKNTLRKNDLSVAECHIFEGGGDAVQAVEGLLKSSIEIYDSGIAGFRTEATKQPIEDVLNICRETLVEVPFL